jgi:hypothetical protein
MHYAVATILLVVLNHAGIAARTEARELAHGCLADHPG